jgi:tetratricopeptide (TPR) repeat protein
MSNKTPEQRAEENVNANFGNRLTAEEHAIVVQIDKEIYYSPEAEGLSFETWREQLTQFDQDLQTRLSQADTAEQRAALRFGYLYLQQTADDAARNLFDKPREDLTYLEHGIKHAQAFLKEGETDKRVRGEVLRLYYNAWNAYYEQGQFDKALDTYQQGIKHAQAFLKAGETDKRVREGVLRLYYNAGNAYYEQGQFDKEIDTYQQGIKHAEAFLKAGETDKGVREWVLLLYYNAGVAWGKQGEFDKALDTYQQGIKHAEAFLKAGETDKRVREQVLKLYSNAGVIWGEQGQVDKAIDTCQQGLKHAQAFLKAGETDKWVREMVLKLYYNAGISWGKQEQFDKALDTYQQGLKHAEAFLKAGETGNVVRERVLNLYDNRLAVLYNTGKIAATLPYLPLTAYLLWQVASQSAPKEWHNSLNSKKIYISHIVFPDHLTTYFQNFLDHLLTQWHDPKRKHRHLTPIALDNQLHDPTEILLRFSEGLYILDEAAKRYQLHHAYSTLTQVEHPKYHKQWQQKIQQPLALLAQRLKAQWATCFPDKALPLPLDSSNLKRCQQQLDALPWYRAWFARKALRTTLAEVQQLLNQDNELKTTQQWRWPTSVSEASTAQTQCLKAVLLKLAPLPAGLSDPATIVLGVLFVYAPDLENALLQVKKHWFESTHADAPTPDSKITVHPTLPLWENVQKIHDALTRSQLLAWAAGSENSRLGDWWQGKSLKLTTKLLISGKNLENAHIKLREALNAWLDGDHSTIMHYLQAAWQQAQQDAQALAIILTALENKDLSTPFDQILKQGHSTVPAQQRALEAMICGKGEETLRKAIAAWLDQQGPVYIDIEDVSLVITHLKRRFESVLKVYPTTWPQSHWGEQVNAWAQVWLAEILNAESPDLAQLWALLERSRIAFTALTSSLNMENWREKMGEQLKAAFKNAISRLTEGSPPPDSPWPPFVTWLKALDELIPVPPSIADCQARLAAEQRALVQPFFDPKQARLRVLWLDQHGLRLRDFPDGCAEQALWMSEKAEGVIAQWTRGLEALRSTARSQIEPIPDWASVITSAPVIRVAETLKQWANGLAELIVIFPAPLGQLPWEALAPLENRLIREVSVRHWFDSENLAESQDSWVFNDPSGEGFCMLKEGEWVAKQFKTEVESELSLFKALQQLNQHRHLHLSTHGVFNRFEPLSSYLTLNDKKGYHWPLWTIGAIYTSADLIVLSACESNLNGQDTAGLLTPIGIGPSLAAAGAKTVVGTLWPCDGVAAYCFSYYFYTIAANEADLAWHQVATKARRALREMTVEEFKRIAEMMGLRLEGGGMDECDEAADGHLREACVLKKRPFEDYFYWAGFTVLGGIERR